ncbi:5-(carboxyamino)imidazole ribonucleotide synthase [soil metagenome]
MNLGILGGGQLARMLALAGHRLGVRARIWDDRPLESHEHGDVKAEIGERFAASFENPSDATIERFARGLDACTLEVENVPAELVERIARRVPVRPGAAALRVAQDRIAEKTLFGELGIATPAHAAVRTRTEFEGGLERVGMPGVLKTRRFGYDGKGQWVIRSAERARGAWDEVEKSEAARETGLIYERFVPFARELSVLVVRGVDGEIRCYGPIENRHRGGILRLSIAPAPRCDGALIARAREMARQVAERLDYVGVLALELFEVLDDAGASTLLANEIAPRVHNSGHWTMDGAITCQFENHVRAALGLPLGATDAVGVTAMVNLVGTLARTRDLAAVEGARVHLYEKTPRAGRKVGHVNFVGRTEDDVSAWAEGVRRLGLAGVELGDGGEEH